MVLTNYLKDFESQVHNHKNEIASQRPGGADFTQAFTVIGNRVTMVGEITEEYERRVARPVSPITQDEARLRFKYLYRDLLFVGTMSGVEYYFIKYLLLYPEFDVTKKIVNRGERRVQFSNLIVWAKDMLDDFYLWDFAVKFRNDVVHFDSIARQSMESPDIEFSIAMTQGQEASGRLRSILALTKSIEHSFFTFIKGLP